MAKYVCKCLLTEPSKMIGYWPLWDSVGYTAEDKSRVNTTGICASVTFEQTGIGDGRTSALFDGTNSYINLYNTWLVSSFDGEEITLSAWLRMTSPAVWSDAATRRAVMFGVDGSNYVHIQKSNTNYRLQFVYSANGTVETINVNNQFHPAWFHVAFTISKDADVVYGYINGVNVGSSSGLGAWTGSLVSTLCVIGAASTTPTSPWSGYLAHVAIWKKQLTADQVKYLSTPW